MSTLTDFVFLDFMKFWMSQENCRDREGGSARPSNDEPPQKQAHPIMHRSVCRPSSPIYRRLSEMKTRICDHNLQAKLWSGEETASYSFFEITGFLGGEALQNLCLSACQLAPDIFTVRILGCQSSNAPSLPSSFLPANRTQVGFSEFAYHILILPAPLLEEGRKD